MVGQEDYSTAIALRKLARAGYATLEQVDSTSDWVLLATPGIGIHRLTAVRRLVRPDWQPPRSRVIKVAERFLSAARFALRFWSIEELEAVIQNSISLPTVERPIEKRLSLEQFAQATRKALRHCEAEQLVQALRQADGRPGEQARQTRRVASDLSIAVEKPTTRQPSPPAPEPRTTPSSGDDAVEDSDRFAHPRHKRLEIVEDYWAARERGLVQNKDSWARSHYHISGKTLLSYEREFRD
jgi:hypothetical protein